MNLSLPHPRSWPGGGGAASQSVVLKVSVQWEWRSGTLAPVQLAPARDHDLKVAREQDTLALENGHRLLLDEMQDRRKRRKISASQLELSHRLLI